MDGPTGRGGPLQRQLAVTTAMVASTVVLTSLLRRHSHLCGRRREGQVHEADDHLVRHPRADLRRQARLPVRTHERPARQRRGQGASRHSDGQGRLDRQLHRQPPALRGSACRCRSRQSRSTQARGWPTGGIVTKHIQPHVGEGGPEAVIPLNDKGHEVPGRCDQQVGDGSVLEPAGCTGLTLRIALDPR